MAGRGREGGREGKGGEREREEDGYKWVTNIVEPPNSGHIGTSHFVFNIEKGS